MHSSRQIQAYQGFALLLSAVCLIAALAGCGEADQSAGRGTPVIELPTQLHEFGEIANDRLAEAFLTIYNRGDAPLKISEVKTSCFCTQGEMVEAVIPPGGEGVLRVTVDPTAVPGNRSSKVLSLMSNDPANPMVQMRITARIGKGARWEPSKINFGDVQYGEGAQAKVRLWQVQSTRMWFSGEFLPFADFVDAKLEEVPDEEWRDPKKPEWDITVTLAKEAPNGEYHGRFVLPTSLPRLRVFSLPVHARVVGGPEAPAAEAKAPAEPVPDDLVLQLEDLQRDGPGTFTVRVKTATSERWYNEGSEFEDYLIAKIHPKRGCVDILVKSLRRTVRICKNPRDGELVRVFVD